LRSSIEPTDGVACIATNVVQNLVIAATVITALVLIALLGELPLRLGVLGHEGFTVIVGLSGLWLLSRCAWRTPVR
jgi:cation transport ATPase